MVEASEPSGTDVTDALEELAHDLENADPRSAELLLDVSRSIRGEEEATWGATSWSRVNLFSVFDVDAMARLLMRRVRMSWASVLELLRATAILAPIVVTWYEVSLAVSAYQADVDAPKSTASSRPFLYLWQTRFDKHLTAAGSFTFDQVARVDAALVVGIILLTLILHSGLVRRDMGVELARRRNQVRRVLGRASLALLDHRVDRPESALLQVMKRSETLLKEIGDERRRVRELTNERGRLVEDLQGVVDDFKAGTASMMQSTRGLHELYTTVASAQKESDRLAGEALKRADGIVREQQQTAELIQRAFSEVAAHARKLDGAAAALQGSAGGMTQATTDLTAAVGALRTLIVVSHGPSGGNGWSQPEPQWRAAESGGPPDGERPGPEGESPDRPRRRWGF